MLFLDDTLVRSEGRELLSNLSKAVGLATMVTALRPDIDDQDELARAVAARAFAVVAGSLGLP